MHFRHSSEIWREFPELAAGVLHAAGIVREVSVEAQIAPFGAMAQARLAEKSES
jgi:hypothetical protein